VIGSVISVTGANNGLLRTGDSNGEVGAEVVLTLVTVGEVVIRVGSLVVVLTVVGEVVRVDPLVVPLTVFREDLDSFVPKTLS
jgi:hypothetical protein